MTKAELNQALRALARNGRMIEADELTETIFELIAQPVAEEKKPAAKKAAAK